jgi:hypothetical protein
MMGRREDFMKAAQGLPAHVVVRIANACNRQCNFAKCNKGEVAEAYATGRVRFGVRVLDELRNEPRPVRKTKAQREALHAERDRNIMAGRAIHRAECAQFDDTDAEGHLRHLGRHSVAEIRRAVVILNNRIKAASEEAVAAVEKCRSEAATLAYLADHLCKRTISDG